ncbi:BTB/POZ protein [Glomus cerebriforme]|uniref:BTB/POZ protein n=1 Tax=Glomus cerebriforme TaxID=658196 RepID=A0A397TR09_9GLOM|nr:BTB/POZ protein [Glomus cerebriforme]
MSTQFLSKLSQNYIELLEDDEYYDITIEVGEDPNVKIFRAHMNILCYRSPYFRRTLSSNKKNNDNGIVHIKLPKMSSEVFQIIIKYIYGGVLSLNGLSNLEIYEVLLAADEFLLQEIVDCLQNSFIENKSEWMEKHFELIYRTSFQSDSFIRTSKILYRFHGKISGENI